MPDAAHDIDQMNQLKDSLTTLQSTFNSISDNVKADQAIFGPHQAGDAYGAFATNWSDAHKTLNGQISGAVAALGDIVAVFQDQEDKIGGAARQACS